MNTIFLQLYINKYIYCKVMIRVVLLKTCMTLEKYQIGLWLSGNYLVFKHQIWFRSINSTILKAFSLVWILQLCDNHVSCLGLWALAVQSQVRTIENKRLRKEGFLRQTTEGYNVEQRHLHDHQISVDWAYLVLLIFGKWKRQQHCKAPVEIIGYCFLCWATGTHHSNSIKLW